MLIAQHLKKENIAEYLLYMWQVEDIIRANHFDLEKIKNNIIDHYQQLGDEQKEEIAKWYNDLIGMMFEEGVQEKGHLQINKNVIINLTDLHLQLLNNPKYPYYGPTYFKVLPFIVELKRKSDNKNENELEICFNALYGVMLLKLRKKSVNPDTEKAVKAISNYLSLLANYYDKYMKHELENEE